jgi:RNA methyltransferase, TrmH family
MIDAGLITSRSNPRIKLLRSLRQRKQRDATGLFLVEGIRHVGEAFEAGAALHSVCYAPDMLGTPYARQLILALERKGIHCLACSKDVIESLAEKDNPQGILAAVHRVTIPLEQMSATNFPWVVALVAPQDPGNVGAILRTLDAVGASGLVLVDGGVDPTHPHLVRASMGAIFWYPVIQATFSQFGGWVAEHGYTVIGTSAKVGQDYRERERYQTPVVLLMGSEREGLTEEQLAVCNQVVHLPMKGHATSLNLAVATGVLLYAMLERMAVE